MTPATVVKADGLVRSFGPVTAVDGVGFEVAEGEVFGLVGPDGAGKTTCLRMLAGLLSPDGGGVEVLGTDVVRQPEAVKKDIGYMSQPAGLYEDLTVRENIEFYADLYQVPRRERRERLERLLEFSGLGPFTERLFRNLSGGMKQKAGLACVLIHRPKVLFLDEPTNGVDPVSRRDFWKILYELRRDRVTIITATTYLDEADRCHRVALFDRGKVRLVMSPGEMRSLMKTGLYDLAAANRPAALKVLKGLPWVAGAAVFGSGIHFSLAEGRGLGDVREALHEAGVEPGRIEAIQPTLEDAYLALVENENNGPGTAAS